MQPLVRAGRAGGCVGSIMFLAILLFGISSLRGFVTNSYRVPLAVQKIDVCHRPRAHRMDIEEQKEPQWDRKKEWESDRLKHLENIRKQLFLVQNLLEDYPGNHDLKSQLKQLKSRYPLYQYEKDLEDALYFGFNNAAKHLALKRLSFMRQLPYTSHSVMRIAVLRKKGDTLTLYRPNGSKVKRFKPRLATTGEGQTRQFQHPTFSPDGKNFAAAELLVENGRVLGSCIVVWSKSSDGTYERVFESATPSTPFYLRFTPDGQSLCFLVNGRGGRTQLWKVDYMKFVGNKDDPEFVRLMEGSPTFFSFTTANPGNYTIVAHNAEEGGVFVLKKQGWEKISSSLAPVQWRSPHCHSAGGGDNVLVVEDGWLVSKSLVKWKGHISKRILPVKGHVYMMVSPDHKKCAVLQQELDQGFYSFTVVEGEESLDPANPAPIEKYEVSTDKLVVAGFFSPDSRKLLCLTMQSTKDDLQAARNAMRLGQNIDCQWLLLDLDTRNVQEMETFRPSHYYTRQYLPCFDSFSRVLSPWAPDSKSFVFMTADGLKHTHITPGEGLGKQWIMPDVEIATWSWN